MGDHLGFLLSGFIGIVSVCDVHVKLFPADKEKPAKRRAGITLLQEVGGLRHYSSGDTRRTQAGGAGHGHAIPVTTTAGTARFVRLGLLAGLVEARDVGHAWHLVDHAFSFSASTTGNSMAFA
jgi:hypothetical protein